MKKKLEQKLFFAVSFFFISLHAWAQLPIDTPTYSPIPKLAITGTPFISTVWLGATNDPLLVQSSPTPSASREIDISDMSTAHEDAMPTPTPGPQSVTGSSLGAKTNGSNLAGNASIAKGNITSGTSNGMGVSSSKNGSGQNSVSIQNSSKMGVTGSSMGMGHRAEPDNPTMIDLYRAGIENYKTKDFDKALTYLKEAIDIKDSTVPAFYYAEANAMIGVIYKFDRPDGAQARIYCEAALRIDPTTATAEKLIHEIDFNTTETEKIYWAAIKSYEKKNYREAIIPLKQVVETKDPTTPSFYFAEAAKTLGIIYQFYQKDSDLAQKYYTIALRIEPKDEVAKGNLAKLQNSK
jgi:Tfp pilus assembly protein PilF